MTAIATSLQEQKEAIEKFLETKALETFPENLYDAVHHIMTLDGKRLRPMMVLMSAQGFNVPQEKAMAAAISIEVFHNFTLVHDDIMDKAKLRRGKITVHEKFGVDKAIVTGDAMLPHAVSLLIQDNADKAGELLNCFNKMGKEVMEGQQFDMEFETRNDVSVDEYMNMIRLKTSVLFGAACEIGAIIGGASEADKRALYDFGLYSGLAFQIMDDYLDTFGDESFGKKIGGDILLNKKSFLLVNAMQKANDEQRKRIFDLFEEKDENTKIKAFQDLYHEMGIPQIALDTMEELHDKSVNAVKSTSLDDENKERIIHLGEVMLRRTK
ncbi:polyprenyl synthetase family protein [Paracrocinitomix mangrovi]|uniref:polyprenyl synthetase family protein n=1 Tax=Paracrocinitomix mangrovi TaxID=2862509 RepID=UPI001C8DE48B|nr:polyprenyl synthetase family protein [Paracrocinitomix mangrovi]UKN02491.1 polyprenyl synthetase family protein [Paracrocinitomix mangrovi]